MPIADVEVVCQSEAEFNRFSAASLASALGRVFGSAPGTTWVKLRLLPRTHYAENESALGDAELPAFVSLLHAHMPQGKALLTEVEAVTRAVAHCLGRPPARVHVRYEPSAAGRQAFGGSLVSGLPGQDA
jgi:phenylpyruvate tautomerase PptA (4-oxalocrotonate tautomerase family)